MGYERRTSVSGWDESGRHVFGWLNGKWKPESALKWARRMGAKGKVTIEHTVIDHSGKGRSGHDGRWNAAGNNEITLESKGR